jgi:hypothetical protein
MPKQTPDPSANASDSYPEHSQSVFRLSGSIFPLIPTGISRDWFWGMGKATQACVKPRGLCARPEFSALKASLNADFPANSAGVKALGNAMVGTSVAS